MKNKTNQIDEDGHALEEVRLWGVETRPNGENKAKKHEPGERHVAPHSLRARVKHPATS